MNKVTTINLNGRAYQLEERGFDALRRYLDTAAAKLADNPDKDEIMADFEQAIADKFDQKLSPSVPNKNVVLEKEVEDIIAAMGPVEGADADSEKENDASAKSSATNAGPRRLYRIPAGEWIMGVCSGLAAYFNIDVTLMRVIWILLTIFTHGFWILAYVVLAVVMPPAKTDEEYARAYGSPAHPPFNAHDFIEEAKKRYAEFQKMHDDHVAGVSGTVSNAAASASTVKEDVNKWKREFKEEMRAKKQKVKQEWRAQQRQWHETRREARRQGPDWQYYNHSDVSPNDAYSERRYGGARDGWQYGFSRAIFGFFAVLVSMVLLAVGVAFVVSLVSLIKFGTVFGYALGAGQPLWIPIVFLAAAFYIIAAPFRMLIQHAWGNARYQSGWADFGRGVIFLAVLALLVYTARDLFPSVNAAYDTAVGWLAARR